MTDAKSTAVRLPTWLEEVGDFVTANAQIVLSGNIRDLYLVSDETGQPNPETLASALWGQLSKLGYDLFLLWDRVDGLQVWPAEALPQALAFVGSTSASSASQPANALPQWSIEELPLLADLLARGMASAVPRVAFLIDYASRIGGAAQMMPELQAQFFTACEKLSHTARRKQAAGQPRMFNPIFWAVDRVNDLPAWLIIGNERVRSKVLPKPDFAARRLAADFLTGLFEDTDDMSAEDRGKAVDTFVNSTEGLTLVAMDSIAELARRRGLSFERIEEAVQLYKIGIAEDPWRSPELHERVAHAEKAIEARVKGQSQAIQKVADILRRAVIGLNGAQAGGAGGGRPKGVLFFAGPTGVGKTELAKAISEVIFGNERAYLRFDMSEFSAEHSQSRLIGAPPGYLGFDAGGELTNGIREKPFSVVLFDEIEKAHPRLLDKFLQILEDGRLTDGSGETVYFSQAIIIFTSNLGIYTEKPPRSGILVPVVEPGEPYIDVAAKVRAAIADYFKQVIGRPEILNRFGDNIVVFDFIAKPIAEQIFEKALRNTLVRVQSETGIVLTLGKDVHRALLADCTKDLANGGRGIINQVEARLVNPLSRALFDKISDGRREVEVTDASESDGYYKVVLG